MKKKALIALVVAALMAIQVPMVALADITHEIDDRYGTSTTEPITYDDNTKTITVGDNITVTTGYAVNLSGRNADIKGNVTNNDASFATVIAKGVTVNVSGDATNNGVGNVIAASGKAIVSVDSAKNDTGTNAFATVYANSGANVNVKNAVTNDGQGYALYAENGATITASSATSGKESSTGNETVFATGKDTSIVINGAVANKGDGKGIFAQEGATVIAGSVESKDDGIEVYKNGGTVIVNGSVKSGDTGILVERDKATVEVGSIEAVNEGVSIYGSNTKVTVNGDVKVTGEEGEAAFVEGATLIVKGNLNVIGVNGIGISTEDSGNVIVAKDVNAKYDGIEIDNSDPSKKTEITVLGTITSDKYGVEVLNSTTDNFDINVYKIVAGDKLFVDADGNAISDQVQNNIHYIIKTAVGSESNLTTSGTTERSYTIDGKTEKIETADAETKITVKVADGYELKAGEIQVTLESDGTYSVVVPRGGGVTLEAVVKAVKQAQSAGGGVWSVSPSKMGSAEAPVSNGAWANVNGAFRYTVNGETVKNAIATIQYKAADGNTYTGSFFFDRNGTMQTGWQQIDGVWYYFNTAQGPTQGMMLTNTTTPDGYQVGANGAWIH